MDITTAVLVGAALAVVVGSGWILRKRRQCEMPSSPKAEWRVVKEIRHKQTWVVIRLVDRHDPTGPLVLQTQNLGMVSETEPDHDEQVAKAMAEADQEVARRNRELEKARRSNPQRLHHL